MHRAIAKAFGRSVKSLHGHRRRRNRTIEVLPAAERLEDRMLLSALNSLVTDGSTINHLEDNDFESLIGDGDNIVEVGEFLVGMFEIQTLDAPIGAPKEATFDSSTDSFTGVFLLKVAAVNKSPDGTVATFQFSPATAADWTTAGIDLPAPSAAGTLAMVFDDPPSAPNEHIQADLGSLSAALDTATNGIKLWEVGLRGDAGEFWSATTTDAGGAADDITAIDTLNFFAGINVTAATAAVGNVVLDKHDHIGFGTPTEIQVDGRIALGQNPVGSQFDIATDADLYILPNEEQAVNGGQITPTGTTCEQFHTGAAADLDTLEYGTAVRGGKQVINEVNPGVFFYYYEFVAPAAGSASILVDQMANQAGFEIPVQNLQQVRLFNTDCNSIDTFTATLLSGGDVQIEVTSLTPGATYFGSVKYQPSQLKNGPVPNPDVVHYDFETYVDAVLASQDPNGINLVPKASPLHGSGQGGAFGVTRALMQTELQQAFETAVNYWRTVGIPEADLSILFSTRLGIADLSGSLLGLAYASNRIVIDIDAAGAGWSIGASSGRFDLLTTITHEVGHALGLPDLYESGSAGSIMHWQLTPDISRGVPVSNPIGPISGTANRSGSSVAAVDFRLPLLDFHTSPASNFESSDDVWTAVAVAPELTGAAVADGTRHNDDSDKDRISLVAESDEGSAEVSDLSLRFVELFSAPHLVGELLSVL